MMGSMLDYDKAADYLRRGQWGKTDALGDWRARLRESQTIGAVEHGLKWYIRQAPDRLFHGLLFLE